MSTLFKNYLLLRSLEFPSNGKFVIIKYFRGNRIRETTKLNEQGPKSHVRHLVSIVISLTVSAPSRPPMG